MNIEIEARFLDIDKQKLLERLRELGALDKNEVLLSEIIFYDKDKNWQDRFVRLRSSGESTTLTYKQNKEQTIDSAQEIEFNLPSMGLGQQFLEGVGLVAFRHQEKKRHTFVLDGVTIDIDSWPQIPTYVELEGPSEADIKAVAKRLNLPWETAVFDDARSIIENRYNILVGSMKWFTFTRFE